MGNINSQDCTLGSAEVKRLSESSNFTTNEIRALWFHFRTITSVEKKTDKIDKNDFRAAMLFRDGVLVDRIFRVFDIDDDGVISFSEYVTCLNTLSNKASNEEKLKFSFQLYDFDCDGLISVPDLTATVAATLRENDVVIPRAAIDELVTATMIQAKPINPNAITFEEYRRFVGDNPLQLAPLTLNISAIIAEYTIHNGVTFATPRLASARNHPYPLSSIPSPI